MSKAVLVMDMPESCDKCTLCCMTPYGEYMCCKMRKNVPDGEKPDWCPLRELSEHKRTIGKENEGDTLLMNVGWNACLNEILKTLEGVMKDADH